MRVFRTPLSWLPLLMLVVLFTACTGGGANPTVKDYSVSGAVKDQTGTGISEVSIIYEGSVSGTTSTKSDGKYEITGLKGTTTIRASKEGWVFSEPQTVDKASSTVDFSGSREPLGAIYGSVEAVHNFPWSVVDNPPLAGFTAQQGELKSFVIKTPMVSESDEMIITFDNSLTVDEQLEVLEELGYQVLSNVAILNAYLVKPLAENPREAVFRANSFSGVRYAGANTPLHLLSVTYPNDPYYSDQWHYPLIRLPQAWTVTTGDNRIRVAVLDSGVKMDHPELQSRLDFDYGFNFIAWNHNFDDDNGHGTHVAGTIGAVTNNGQAVAGVMWDVDILPLKVLDSAGSGDTWSLAVALLYAAGLLDQDGMPFNPYPADVINLSLGTSARDDFLGDTIEYVLDYSDTLIVAAAGNDGGPVNYPAAFPGVIAVGAVDYNYPNTPRLAPYSSWGHELDLVAPGGDVSVDSNADGFADGVLSTYFNESGDPEYWFLQGTSMAAPHVSGVIGLMLAAGIPSNQVIDILHRTSMPLGEYDFSPYHGYGLINAYWAVNAVDKMRVILGVQEGELVYIVDEVEVHPQGGEFKFENIPPGDYIVTAWVDVREGANIVEAGDYYGATGVFRVDGDLHAVAFTVHEVQ